MDNEIKYCYDAKFEGNVLVIGRTGCSKTTFVQNLAKNRMFGEIKKALWLSKISLSREREDNIRDCFEVWVDFRYPKILDEFDDLLEFFQREKITCNDNCMGGNIKLDSLTVMDSVSVLADRLETFKNFSIVSKKFGITCSYFFHTMYPTRNN